MERSESTIKLITEDNDGGYINDYSSGYESSSGSSDNETQVSIKHTLNLSQLDKIWKEQNQHATKEKMNYQNTSDLCSHLRYIISMPELCDVTFLVGSRRIPVYGVKAIMGTRSRVIYNIMLKKQRELEFQDKGKSKHSKEKRTQKNTGHHLVISVRKYQPEDFQKLIEYLHCGSVGISTSDVIGLLCGASHFELDDLVRACWDFIDHCSRNNSICLMIPAARRYSQHTTGKMIISWITTNARRTSVV